MRLYELDPLAGAILSQGFLDGRAESQGAFAFQGKKILYAAEIESQADYSWFDLRFEEYSIQAISGEILHQQKVLILHLESANRQLDTILLAPRPGEELFAGP